MKKKAMTLGIMTLVATACLSLTACNPDDSPKEAVSFVSIDINPSIELTLDADNKVVSVYGANEDGQVLLYGETGIVGTDIETAVDKITALAIELGYLDEDNKVVQTSVTGGKNSNALLDKINAKITASAFGLNMTVDVSGSEAYSLLRKLAEVKAEYPDNEAIQSLTPEQFKLVISATEAGDISIETAVSLDTDKLVKMISDAHKNAKEFATDAYNKAVVLAKNAYDTTLGAVSDGIYTTYYTVHHPMKAYYGFAYQGYKTTARGLNKIADALEFAEEISVYPLDQTQAQSIADILGVSVEELQNSKGEVTVKSIEAFADKTFKNSETSEALEKIKTELTTALSNVENAISVKIEEIAEEYAPQIETIKNSVNTIIEGITTLENIIPSALMSQFREIKADMTDLATNIANIISDGKIQSTEIRTLANAMEAKSQNALKQIENDLTEDELNEIAQLQKTAIQSIENAKAQLENAISTAEQTAKDYLQNLKNQRKETL